MGEPRLKENQSLTEQEVGDIIEAYVRKRFRIPEDDFEFNRTLHLYDEGYVDSRGVFDLIEFLQKEFTVEVPDDKLYDPNFTNIDGIAEILMTIMK